jgi:hypothetical protein
VIFAVDNSVSMVEEHIALQEVFDTLPTQLLEVGNGIEDFHLGVINGCPIPGWLFNYGDSGFCDYSTGANYMSSNSPDLFDEFACVMELSNQGYNDLPQLCQNTGALDGDNEQPASAAAAALRPENLADQNAGFLRDDALLFIVTMSDEDEHLIDGIGNPVDHQDIIDGIVAAKGNIDHVIFLGVGGDSFCDGPYGSAGNAPNLKDIAQPFIDAERGIFWDICGGDLPAALAAGIQIVDQACLETPPD